MDRTVKFLLGLIALSLIMLNMQLAGVAFVSEAKAQGAGCDCSPWLQGIENAISGLHLTCN